MNIPVPGYQGGSLNRKGQSVSNDAASTEKLRMEYMKKEKLRIEKERAKQDLTDKSRKLDLNKRSIADHEAEIRRLQGQEGQVDREVRSAEKSLKATEDKLLGERKKLEQLKADMQKTKTQLDHLTAEYNGEVGVVQHLEAEKNSRQREGMNKQNNSNEAELKRKRQLAEIERLKGEDARLEQEIRTLQAKIR